MTLWKLTLSYDGTGFHGWQVQPHLRSVQGTLSDALFQMTGERVLPQGSGRTDAGVHALAQVASFSLDAHIPAPNLLRALNRILPASIRVLTAEEAEAGFHARHSAMRKSYEYRIFELRQSDHSKALAGNIIERVCPPFLSPYVWDCRWPLDLAKMQHAAAMLLGTHDFTSFAAADPDLSLRSQVRAEEPNAGPNPVKTIFASAIEREKSERGAELVVYRVTGSGFLHHMVRNIVGTLVDVGRGALAPDQMPRILAARSRSAAGPTAPARGLFLAQVDYEPSHVHYGERDIPAEEQHVGAKEASA